MFIINLPDPEEKCVACGCISRMHYFYGGQCALHVDCEFFCRDNSSKIIETKKESNLNDIEELFESSNAPCKTKGCNHSFELHDRNHWFRCMEECHCSEYKKA